MSSEAKAVEMVNLEINGQALQAPKGSMIIHVADDAGIVIPRFCYHKKLPIAANCRMCLVEVDGVPKPLPACATPINEGMKVYTDSPRAINAQRGVMEFLLINHPLDCPICDQGGECELQDVAMGYGRSISRFTETKRVVKDKNIGPLIATEMTRCIHCTRCIRTLDVVGGVKELGATGRGMHTVIGTYIERNVDSEMSGNVIDVCPVGALTSKPFRFSARAWELRQHPSIASHDCVGSNTSVHTYENRVMRVVPRENESINETWLSDRDRFSYEGLNSDDRLTSPMIKIDGVWEETDWDVALDHVVDTLNEIRISKGDDQVGALVSPSATLEEMYLIQKLMRGMGMNNIDHRLRQSDFSDQNNISAYPSLGMAIEDIESLDAVLIVGANIRKDQPIIGHRFRKAHEAGARIMFVNGIDYPLTYTPEENIVSSPYDQINTLACVLKAVNEANGSSAPGELANLLSSVEVTDTHKNIAKHLIDAESAAVILGVQAGLHPQASALRSLAHAISQCANTGIGYLTEGANSSGAWLTGVVPHRVAGGNSTEKGGLHTAAMLGNPLAAYMLFNVEPENDGENARIAVNAMAYADFVVSFSSYRTAEIEQYADVMLPISPVTETSGTFINIEGKWQSFKGVVRPLGDTRPGWKVLRVLGNMFDIDGFEHLSSEDVLDECKQTIGENNINNGYSITSVELGTEKAELMRISDLPLYAIDMTVRRAASLQETHDARHLVVHMNTAQARKLDIADASQILIRQEGDWVSLPLTINDGIPDDCVMIPAAVSGNYDLGGLFGPVEIEKD